VTTTISDKTFDETAIVNVTNSAITIYLNKINMRNGELGVHPNSRAATQM
jgi:hypothetical protein